MRIAIVVDHERALMGNRGTLRRRTETLVGRKTIFVHSLDEVNQDAAFEMIQSLIGSKASIEGLLICQPASDDPTEFQRRQILQLIKPQENLSGARRLPLQLVYEALGQRGVGLPYYQLATFCAKLRVESWLTGLTRTRSIQCRQDYYDPKANNAEDMVLAAIDAFPVVYVRSLNDLKQSTTPNRYIRPPEVAAIFSEHWREITTSGVRHLPDLIPTKIGKRSVGYREIDVYEYLVKKLSQANTLA